MSPAQPLLPPRAMSPAQPLLPPKATFVPVLISVTGACEAVGFEVSPALKLANWRRARARMFSTMGMG